MIYNFLYGRLDDGYACVNKDELPFTNDDYDRLKSFLIFDPPEASSDEDMPEEFYCYNELLSTGRVGIVGRTVFVKGGTGLSGGRDTSMIQKYIFTEEDYDRFLSSSRDIFEKRSYYRNVEEYLNAENAGIDRLLNGTQNTGYDEPGINRYKLSPESLGLSNEVFIDLLYCCIKAFADRERKVYIYLPENTRKGTFYAKCLMKLVLDSIPGFLLSNAGFVTYSASFESRTQNPVPNEVSVIFIAKTKENYLKRSRIDSRNYVFDFENGINPSLRIDDNTYNTVRGMWLKTEVRDVLDECLNRVFRKGTGVPAEMFASLLVLARDIPQDSFERILNDKKVAILDILKYSPEELLPDGLTMLENNILVIFDYSELDGDFLSFAGQIYDKADEYKNYVTIRLCDEALNKFNQGFDQDIFDITDFEYINEDLNDDILDMLYSKENYFPVAEQLFLETVIPVMGRQNVKFSDRLKKVLDFILNSLVKKYKQFVEAYCFGYIKEQVDRYLGEIDAGMLEKFGVDQEDGSRALSEKGKMEASGTRFEVICYLEELLGGYTEAFGQIYSDMIKAYLVDILEGIKDNYRIATQKKTKDLIVDWEKKYGQLNNEK